MLHISPSLVLSTPGQITTTFHLSSIRDSLAPDRFPGPSQVLLSHPFSLCAPLHIVSHRTQLRSLIQTDPKNFCTSHNWLSPPRIVSYISFGRYTGTSAFGHWQTRLIGHSEKIPTLLHIAGVEEFGVSGFGARTASSHSLATLNACVQPFQLSFTIIMFDWPEDLILPFCCTSQCEFPVARMRE